MTHPNVEFLPDAIIEAEAAYHWYAERNTTAARAFLLELTHAVEKIAEAPLRWPAFKYNTRRYIFPRFPFSLVYRIKTEIIEVIAVARQKRKPGYWGKK